MDITGKKISILGAVRSGVAAAKLAKTFEAVPFVSDMASKDKIENNVAALDSEKINYETGGHTDKVFNCDFIVTSPGVPSNAAVLIKAEEKGIPVFSELEFASWFCKGELIAITGTNGKTTTTALCAFTLNECGLNAAAAGNIGLAFSEIAADVKQMEYVALEVSSFQLDYIKDFKPKFSMILNISPDHLDRYENDFAKYVEAKMRITENQDGDTFFISNADDDDIPKDFDNNEVKKFQFSLTKEIENGSYLNKGKLFFAINGQSQEVCDAEILSIKGEHNIANALAVLTVAKLLNLPNDKIASAFIKFPGVEHRLEFVREINGVQYVNDSKATNVDSVWYALRSFKKPIYLILGGRDKGNDYNLIKELCMQNVVKIYAIGESAKKVFDFFKDIVAVEIKDSIESCIEAGRAEAETDSIILLSPACASFDMFKDYEHRGKVFKEAVNRLNS